jgi:hypothetical protein
MARTVLALALLMSLVTPALAGERCARRRPDPIVILPEVRLDEEGHWARTRGETTTYGVLPAAATERVASIANTAKPAQLVKCIDALIAAPKSKAAKRACTVSAG